MKTTKTSRNARFLSFRELYASLEAENFVDATHTRQRVYNCALDMADGFVDVMNVENASVRDLYKIESSGDISMGQTQRALNQRSNSRFISEIRSKAQTVADNCGTLAAFKVPFTQAAKVRRRAQTFAKNFCAWVNHESGQNRDHVFQTLTMPTDNGTVHECYMVSVRGLVVLYDITRGRYYTIFGDGYRTGFNIGARNEGFTSAGTYMLMYKDCSNVSEATFARTASEVIKGYRNSLREQSRQSTSICKECLDAINQLNEIGQ